MEKAIAIASGGLDSTVMLYWAKDKYDVSVLFFNYGQNMAERELPCLRKTCSKLGYPLEVVDLSNVKKLLRSPLTGEEGDLTIPIVPNRNMIMLSIAGGYAVSTGASTVMYGPHKTDKAGFPDCRPEFVHALTVAFRHATDNKDFKVIAPLIDLTKTEIVALGRILGVPFEDTYTCYRGGEIACGTCGSCKERIKAFKENKMVDPIPYQIEIDWGV